MRTGAWILALTLLLVASMAASDAVCVLGDQETVANNTATGYVPSAWKQTTHADFLRGTGDGTEVSLASDSVALKLRYKDPGVYVLVGGSSTAFYRYDLTSRAWTAMAPAPVKVSDGSSMVHDGSGRIYLLAGGASAAIYRYDVRDNAWSLFATAPQAAGAGGDITWDGTYLYVLTGTSSSRIWRLDPAGRTWTSVATVPSVVGTGASVLAQEGSLYVIRGGDTTTFWRYSLASRAWTVRDNTNAKVGAGSDLILGPGGTLYCSYGKNERQLGSYNINANAWTTVTSQPFAVGYGGGLTYGGQATIYSINGNSYRYFYSYNRTLNSWAQMTPLPAAVSSGGCLVFVPPVLAGYSSSGVLTSELLDTGTAGTRYVQVFWDRTVPAGTVVSMEVRASDALIAGAPNAPWRALGAGSSGDLTGLEGRYVQWRVTLTTSDAGTSPQLEEVRLYYYHA